MNNKLTSLMVVMTLIVIGYYVYQKQQSVKQFERPLFIAHASGGIDGLTYLNSLEALNYNYEIGQRYFEVDFSWTSDDELVLIHDWKFTYKRLFNNETEVAPTEQEFLKMRMRFNQTQLSLKQFSQWINKHPEAILVADVKAYNIKGLEKLVATIENPFHRIIPQIYKINNYQKIIDLGFEGENIMFAMYKTMKLTDEILEFIKTNKLFAISVQPAKEYFNTILKEIGNTDTYIYSLTINDLKIFNEYRQMGLDGTVTDFLFLMNNEIVTQN